MPTFSIFNNEPDMRSFTAGETIFHSDQPSDFIMYAVLEGEVEITRQGRVLETIAPGVYLGSWPC